MREHFDLDPSILYLNAGTHSICPRVITEAVVRHVREYEKNPTSNLFAIWGALWQVQQKLAAFFGAHAEDVILRPNITSLMNLFILGMPLSKGSEILTTDLEYGAILNICRYKAANEGLTVRSLHLPGSAQEMLGLTSESLRNTVLQALKPETRMLVLSHVMTGNGLVLPIREIAAETRKRGVLLVVDGAHSAGFLDLDLRKLENVDFYAASLHKWMMGPKGTSLGWISKRHQSSLSPLLAGWTTFETPEPFQPFGGGSSFQMRFLMSACFDFAPFLALAEMIRFLEKLTPPLIHARVTALQTRLEEQVTSLTGWPSISPPIGPLRGPLMSFEIPSKLSAMGFSFVSQLYRDSGLQVAAPMVQGRACLRLSPHIHNSDEEMDRTARLLRDFSETHS